MNRTSFEEIYADQLEAGRQMAAAEGEVLLEFEDPKDQGMECILADQSLDTYELEEGTIPRNGVGPNFQLRRALYQLVADVVAKGPKKAVLFFEENEDGSYHVGCYSSHDKGLSRLPEVLDVPRENLSLQWTGSLGPEWGIDLSPGLHGLVTHLTYRPMKKGLIYFDERADGGHSVGYMVEPLFNQ